MCTIYNSIIFTYSIAKNLFFSRVLFSVDHGFLEKINMTVNINLNEI